MIVVNARIEADAESIEKMKSAIAAVEEASRAEEGCDDYTFSVELSNPTHLRITEREHAAVQYAVLSALFVLPGRLVGGLSGQGVEAVGYAAWFAGTAGLGIPALALLPFARRRLQWLEEDPAR